MKANACNARMNAFPKVAGLLAAGIFFSACATQPYALRMKARGELMDETSVAPELSSQHYSKVMVIPPSGTARGQFDDEISYIEREFIGHGITVISGAITGRVVLDGQEEAGEKKMTTGEQLSDIERALIMAKKTGVEVLLQIGQWNWSKGDQPSRYFIVNDSIKQDPKQGPVEFREVSYNEYQAWKGKKRMFSSPVMSFIGKLVDVQSGKIMASFKIVGAANWDLPEDYVAQIDPAYNLVLKQNYSYGPNAAWLLSAKERVTRRIIGAIAKRINGI